MLLFAFLTGLNFICCSYGFSWIESFAINTFEQPTTLSLFYYCGLISDADIISKQLLGTSSLFSGDLDILVEVSDNFPEFYLNGLRISFASADEMLHQWTMGKGNCTAVSAANELRVLQQASNRLGHQWPDYTLPPRYLLSQYQHAVDTALVLLNDSCKSLDWKKYLENNIPLDYKTCFSLLDRGDKCDNTAGLFLYKYVQQNLVPLLDREHHLVYSDVDEIGGACSMSISRPKSLMYPKVNMANFAQAEVGVDGESASVVSSQTDSEGMFITEYLLFSPSDIRGNYPIVAKRLQSIYSTRNEVIDDDGGTLVDSFLLKDHFGGSFSTQFSRCVVQAIPGMREVEHAAALQTLLTKGKHVPLGNCTFDEYLLIPNYISCLSAVAFSFSSIHTGPPRGHQESDDQIAHLHPSLLDEPLTPDDLLLDPLVCEPFRIPDDPLSGVSGHYPRLLVLGMGAGSSQRLLHNHHSCLDVYSVDISTRVHDLAHEYFHFPSCETIIDPGYGGDEQVRSAIAENGLCKAHVILSSAWDFLSVAKTSGDPDTTSPPSNNDKMYDIYGRFKYEFISVDIYDTEPTKWDGTTGEGVSNYAFTKDHITLVRQALVKDIGVAMFHFHVDSLFDQLSAWVYEEFTHVVVVANTENSRILVGSVREGAERAPMTNHHYLSEADRGTYTHSWQRTSHSILNHCAAHAYPTSLAYAHRFSVVEES